MHITTYRMWLIAHLSDETISFPPSELEEQYPLHRTPSTRFHDLEALSMTHKKPTITMSSAIFWSEFLHPCQSKQDPPPLPSAPSVRNLTWSEPHMIQPHLRCTTRGCAGFPWRPNGSSHSMGKAGERGLRKGNAGERQKLWAGPNYHKRTCFFSESCFWKETHVELRSLLDVSKRNKLVTRKQRSWCNANRSV